MDIRDVQSRNINPADEPRGARGAGQTPAARNASERSDDRVTLSPRAHAFQETRRAALDVPDVRTDRVDAVRSKLADGTLGVDPQRIARALLDQGIVRF
jgi:flagellar biosynthesis anti-sigma factor FlgM